MLLTIPQVLNPHQVLLCRQKLAAEEWVDGRVTAGHQSAQAKANLQLPVDAPVAQELGNLILGCLEGNELFMSAALPQRVVPPLFSRYTEGMAFGNHVDNAIRSLPGRPERLRTDVSATLFLSDSEDYDGGELLVEDTFGVHRVKLPAGDMVLYPASSLHRVSPVTRGERLAAFFWVQSLVRDDAQRTLLLDLDTAVQGLRRERPDHPTALDLTNCYHNLIRMWAEP